MHAGIALFSAVVVAALDQLTKSLVIAKVPAGHSIRFGWIDIHSVFNRTPRGRWMALLVLETVWLAGAIEVVPVLHNPVVAVALGAALGGAAGNVIDRAWRNGVVDYIDLGFHSAFNLADVAIVAGVGLAVIGLCVA